MMSGPLSTAPKLEPYWYEEAPRRARTAFQLPVHVDVAIVGGGYTGLSAALTLARRSREVLVFDAGDAGWGASSRNQGHLGLNRHLYANTLAKYGKAKALAVFREDEAALEFTMALIERENIRCYFRRNGRFVGAAKPSHYEKLARDIETLKREVSYEAHIVPHADVRSELGTHDYVGGEIRPREGSLHTALFHTGLLDRSIEAGARVATETRVQKIERASNGFILQSSRGRVNARDVLIATNALTGDLVPYLKRRIVPVNGAGIATEPLGRDLIRSVIPNLRACVDTRMLSRSVRPSPDETRIIFGSRATMKESDPRVSAKVLRRLMVGMFPQLKNVEITHSWLGPTGITFNRSPQIGVLDGMHYAVGFTNYGVAQAPYLGHKAALKILRANNAATAFDDIPSETRPFYNGNPWFLPAVVMYYRYKDLLGR